MKKFCDYFRSARFYLYSLAWSCGPYRFTFFYRYSTIQLVIDKKQWIWKKIVLDVGKNWIYNTQHLFYSTRIDWLIELEQELDFEIACPAGGTFLHFFNTSNV